MLPNEHEADYYVEIILSGLTVNRPDDRSYSYGLCSVAEGPDEQNGAMSAFPLIWVYSKTQEIINLIPSKRFHHNSLSLGCSITLI